MTYKCTASGKNYKNKISISLKDRNKIIYLYTDDDDFNKTNVFTSRRSMEIPKSIQGEAEYEYENGGGCWQSWEDVSDAFGKINSQEIIDVVINGNSINKEYEDLAKKSGYKMLFPLLYHFQIFRDDSNNIVNWYPTTGSTTVQDKTEKYSIEKLGFFDDFNKLLTYIKNEIN